MAIDAAIAAAQVEKPEQRSTVQIQLRSGRMVAINVPTDLSPLEAIDLIGYVANGLAGELAKTRRPGPQLLVPTGVRIARG